MNRQQMIDRLDFENHLSLNHNIQPVPAIEAYSLVNNGKRHLTVKAIPLCFSSQHKHSS